MKWFVLLLGLTLAACGRGEFGDTANAGDIIAPSENNSEDHDENNTNNAVSGGSTNGRDPGLELVSNNTNGSGSEGTNNGTNSAQPLTAFDLFEELSQSRTNFIFSPTAVNRSLLALEVTSAGETQRLLNVAELEPLSERDLRESVVGLWVDDSQRVEQQFVDDSSDIGADVTRLNLQEQDTARATINNTIRDLTDGYAIQVLEPGTLAGGSVVIAGASVYNTAWETAFDPALRRTASFAGGANKNFIGANGTFSISSDERFTTATIPLANGDLALFVMPNDRDTNALISEFDNDLVQHILAEQLPQEIELHIPQVDLETRITVEDLGGFGIDSEQVDVSAVGDGAELNTWMHYDRTLFAEEGIETPGVPSNDAMSVSFMAFDQPFVVVVVEPTTLKVRLAGRVLQ